MGRPKQSQFYSISLSIELPTITRTIQYFKVENMINTVFYCCTITTFVKFDRLFLLSIDFKFYFLFEIFESRTLVEKNKSITTQINNVLLTKHLYFIVRRFEFFFSFLFFIII